jgi:hypothetical protein
MVILLRAVAANVGAGRLAPNRPVFNIPDGHNALICSRHENCVAGPPGLSHHYVFDPETIALLRTTLDRAWESLPQSRKAGVSRSLLAERILKAAARGERDPERLRALALYERPHLKVAS